MKLVLTIGMIPLALDVYSAVEESNLSRSMYVKDNGTLHKVGMTTYDTITGKNVERTDIIKCLETPEGELVEVSDDEIQALLVSENGTCTFLGFLPRDQFDYSTEKPYQVRPQKIKAKVNPYEKPFALIMQAMEATDTVALLSFVNRGKTRYAGLDHNGTMATLRFDEEVRAERPLPEVALSDQEKAMGVTFIDTFKLDEAPVFHDDDSAKLMQFAVDKAKALAEGGEVVIPVADETTAAPADDLMALLQASVKQ
jgi:DNA end-binding protein Ku